LKDLSIFAKKQNVLLKDKKRIGSTKNVISYGNKIQTIWEIVREWYDTDKYDLTIKILIEHLWEDYSIRSFVKNIMIDYK
jgi:hypothetical protein